jgi:hypothetical protein
MKTRNLLLIVILAILALGGTFTCHDRSGDTDVTVRSK